MNGSDTGHCRSHPVGSTEHDMEHDPYAECVARANAARNWAATAAPSRRPGLDSASWTAAHRAGFLRPATPGPDAVGAAEVMEALGHGGADRGWLFALGAHWFGCCAPLSRHATPSQRATWEPGLHDGSLVGALAVTEPSGGSSFDGMATAARHVDGGFRLDGSKTLVTNAPDADVLLVLARQFPERGPLGLTMFVVPRTAPGLTIRPIATTGLPGAPMGDVVMQDCHIGLDATLGAPGAGLRVFQSAMAWERTLLLAGFLGAAEHDLARAAHALADRNALGHQAVTHRFARMHLRLAAARHLLHDAARKLDAGREDITAAAMAKLVTSEAVVECARDVAHLLAGAGWRGAPLDAVAAVADTMGTLFASGTSEVQLDLIARHTLAVARRP